MYEAGELDRIYEATDGRCHLCWEPQKRENYPRAWEVDHSRARVNGGSDYFRNLKVACISCNRSKQDGTTSAARRANGHVRAPVSALARGNRATEGALLGAGIGAFFGPLGVVVCSAIGALLGHNDDARPLHNR